MATETSLGIEVAARCWTETETETIEMIPELAKAFARRFDGYFALIEAAWGIIANAGGGNWEHETLDWNAAARAWRTRYHALLAATGDPSLSTRDSDLANRSEHERVP